MIKRYFSLLNSKAIFIIGFLLAYPIVLIAGNSVPVRLPIKSLFYMSLAIWMIIHFIKPIKQWISGIVLVVQLTWFYSLMADLPFYVQEGFERIMPGGVQLARFIYEKLYGTFYAQTIAWIRNFLLHEPQDFYNIFYNIFIICIISAIMILVLRLIEKRTNWKFFLFASIYFVIAWFIYVSSIKSYFSIYFIGLTAYKQFLIYEELVQNAKGLGEGTKFYNYSSALVIGTVIMTCVLLVSNFAFWLFPVDSLNEKIHQVVPAFSSIRSEFKSIPSSKVFSFNSTMYSPNDYLGGPITERDYSIVMRIKSEESSLYLRGRAKNVYDGSSWSSDFTVYKNNLNDDPEAMIPSEHLSEITVYPEIIKTRSIFSPYKYYSSSFVKNQIYGNEDDIVYRKSKVNNSLERYTVEYIKEEYIPLYDTLDESLRENYLALPEEGLSNTEALVKRLTEDMEDPYEKMKTLERYLRDNYYYTLDTRPVDTSVDFVENFLFDEKSGYCTYFATSLAVMGRMTQVPTRYVEGFIASNFTDFDGYYEVSANRAHAWTEAYIEGQGWVRFEATPTYRNGDEAEADETDDTFVPGDSSGDDFEDEDNFGPEDDFEIVDDYQKAFNPMDFMLIILYVLIAVGLIYVIYRKAKRMYDDIHKGSINEKIMNRIQYMLSMSRLIDEDPDLAKLPKTVIRETAELLNVEIGICESYIDERLYSQKTFTESEYETFNQFFIAYEKAMKKELSFVTYYIVKVVLNTLYHKSYYA